MISNEDGVQLNELALSCIVIHILFIRTKLFSNFSSSTCYWFTEHVHKITTCTKALYFSITITNILLLLLKSVNRENKSIPWRHNAYIPLGFHELNSLSLKWNGIEYSKTYVYFVSWIWLTKILSICFACVTMHVCFVAVSLGIVIHLNLRIHFWFVSISLINWSNMLYSKQFDLRTICGNYSTQHEHNTIRNQCSAFDFSFSWNAKLTLHQLNGICLAGFSWLNDIGGMTRKKVYSKNLMIMQKQMLYELNCEFLHTYSFSEP